MKLGILTFHFENNYGALLQSIALNSFLSEVGFESEIINFEPYNLKYPNMIIPFTRSSCKEIGWLKIAKRILFNLYNLRINKIIKKINFYKFRKRFMNIGNSISDKITLVQEFNNLDLIVIGSDQVWNLDIIEGNEYAYLGTDIDDGINSKKISFAASFGDNENLFKLNNLQLDILKKFYKISVREKSSAESLSKISLLDIHNHLDPIFLFDQLWYEKFANLAFLEKLPSEFILIYDVDYDPQIEDLVNSICNDQLSVFSIGNLHKFNTDKYKNCSSIGPSEFISLFNAASIVMTNSFHGVAFSILFKKDFYCTLPSIRQDRIYDLLNTFGLDDRLFSADKKNLFDKIDFSKSEKIIGENLKSANEYFKEFIY